MTHPNRPLSTFNPERLEKIATLTRNRFPNAALVLEDIYDPHNAAAAFRNCDAFGIGEVHLIFDQQPPFNPKKIGKKTSGTSNKWLNFHIHKSTEAGIQALKAEGYTLLATCLTPAAVSLYDIRFNPNKKVAFCFGNEHRGLSQTFIERSDRQLKIPMRGMVQSLNLSVTVGIVEFEYARQLYGNTH